MTKEDIEEFDLVLLRDGRVCIVIKENGVLLLYGRPSNNNTITTIISNLKDDYTDDLKIWMDADNKHSHDIIAVSKRGGERFLGAYLIEILLSRVQLRKYLWDWKREEVKEVTMADVEEKFGCKVKIVKEE